MTIDSAAIRLGLETLVLGDLHDPGDGEAEIFPTLRLRAIAVCSGHSMRL